MGIGEEFRIPIFDPSKKKQKSQLQKEQLRKDAKKQGFKPVKGGK